MIFRDSDFQFRQSRGHLVTGVHIVAAGNQVEAGNNQPAVPDDGFAGLIETAVQTVVVGAECNPFHLALGRNPCNGVAAEVRDVEIPLLGHNHAVGGEKLIQILRDHGGHFVAGYNQDNYDQYVNNFKAFCARAAADDPDADAPLIKLPD